jgi:hypothetical protein
LLLMLSVDQRLAWVLVDLLGLDAAEAAAQRELAAARTQSLAFGPQGKWQTPVALRQKLRSLSPTVLTPRS